MRSFARARTGRFLLLIAAMFALGGGLAYATIPSSGGNVYTACMLKGVGTLRLIDPSLPSSNLMNRVLIWNRIPTTNDAPADVVVGQPNFTSTSLPGNTPNAKSMRGPQGVWIQNGRLYVADTQNNRVLIFNRIPTSNGAAADVVLGQPNMTTFVEPDLTQQKNNVTANQLLNPVSVTSDGVHIFVTDLGYNRVLIWNSIPSTNGAAADVAIGQPDMVSSIANNAFSTDPNDTTNKQTPVLCTVSNGTDTNSNPTYPASCNATAQFSALCAGRGQPAVHRRWRQRPGSGASTQFPPRTALRRMS